MDFGQGDFRTLLLFGRYDILRKTHCVIRWRLRLAVGQPSGSCYDLFEGTYHSKSMYQLKSSLYQLLVSRSTDLYMVYVRRFNAVSDS